MTNIEEKYNAALVYGLSQGFVISNRMPEEVLDDLAAHIPSKATLEIFKLPCPGGYTVL